MKIRAAGKGTKLLILALFVIGVVGILNTLGQINVAQKQRDILARQVEEQEATNLSLADDLANSKDPKYLEDIARSQLGLLEPGEIKFVDTSN